MAGISRRKIMKAGAAAAGAAALPMPFVRGVAAQARNETLVAISENGPNSLDIMGVGANRPAYEASWNIHDRLMSYGVKKDPNGNDHYDYAKLTPELAESWDLKPTSVTFKLRKDAKFHDGSPVTAKDVKWSFDRAVTVGGFPTFQMKAGSLEKPEQFVAVDDHTLRVDFLRADKLTLPDLAVVVPAVINSGLAKKHATEKDPWAMDWYKTNHASGGAYRVTRFTPGTEIVYERNDSWKCGPLPSIKRVVWRIVPSSGNRRALLERGDADICLDMASKDFAEMAAAKKLKVIGTPVENALQYIGMNVNKPPFNNVKVRQAIAHAIPYEKIMQQAVFGRAAPMFGAPDGAMDATWPQKSPFKTDIALAKKLMAEAGAGEISTAFSFDLGLAGVNEPIALLIQESLAQIGIKTAINKVPGANWRGELLKKEMPLITNTFGGWLNYPEYFFFWCYHGQDAVFNTMSYKSAAMDKLIETARFETDKAKYEAAVKGFVKLAWDDVPRIPLYQPYLDVAMQQSIGGYRYWFHRQLDYRQLKKG